MAPARRSRVGTTIDWLNILDVELAVRNCYADVLGDWHRDPWNWPEIGWTGKRGAEYLVQRLNSSGGQGAALLDVPKENFVLRPALVLDPVDRLVFEALVDRISNKLIGDLPPWVYGWRLERVDPRPGLYANRSAEWATYRHDLVALAEYYPCGLATDVVSFFASVPSEPLLEMIEGRSGSTAIFKRLADLILTWNQIAGRSGLPQRSNASSVLANMYLQPLDDVLGRYGHRRHVWLRALVGRDVAAARWMDDIWLFGTDRADLRKAQMTIQGAFQSIGLQLNSSKTILLEGDELVAKAREIEHSGVDQHLSFDPPDGTPLSELILELVDEPEVAASTSLRFATVRMRDHGRFEDVPLFVAVADRMPHGSQYLARLFRDSGEWRNLTDWYEGYAKSSWGSIDWALGQLGTMFPSNAKNVSPVDRCFEEAVESLASLSRFAVAAQRLAAWHPKTARALFREVATGCSDPHLRRVMALAALGAGEETPWIKKLLSEFEANSVTLAMLKDRSYRPVKVIADFEGDVEE